MNNFERLLEELSDDNLSERMFGQQLKNVKTIWERTAKESLDVEYKGGITYAYGSELATLRLLQYFRDSKNAIAGYSKKLKQFYFSLFM